MNYVEGNVQALLTLCFQICILLVRKRNVVAALNWLERLRGGMGLQGTVQAECGSDFGPIASIEKEGRQSVYYTDPQRTDQKGGFVILRYDAI